MKLRTHTRDDRGAVAVIAAAGLVLAMIAASLAVDLGSLAQEAREDQKVADLAALDAVRALDDPSPDPVAAAVASAVRNEFECPDTDLSDDCGLTVQWSDSITGLFTDSPLTLPLATTVRVTTKSRHDNNFRFVGSTSRSVSRKASAALGNGAGCFYPDECERTYGTTETAISPIGTVRVGSSAASFSSSEAVILNRLLTRTVGGTYTLDAVGWQGLAAGNVKFSKLRGALGGSYAVGSPNEVLDADLTYRQLLDATVDALNADGDPATVTSSTAARNFLITLRGQVDATAGANIRFRNLFNIAGNVGSGNDVADVAINVKDIVVGGMILADTDHFASMDLTAADIPGLPGNGVTTVRFGLIEAPQSVPGPPKDAFGAYRTTAETAQVRLLIESNVVVPITGMGDLNLKVPYYLKGAGATASLDTLDCAAGDAEPDSVDIFGVTEVAAAYLGTVADADLKNRSIPTPGAVSKAIGSLSALVATVTVTASGNAISSVPGHSGHMVFSPTYDGVTSKPVPGGTELTLPTAVDGNMTVAVTGTLPVGVTVASILSDIHAVVNPTLTPLNNRVVKPLQRALGLSLGAADVWAPPVQNCNPTSFNTDPTSSVGPDAPYGHQIPSLVE